MVSPHQLTMARWCAAYLCHNKQFHLPSLIIANHNSNLRNSMKDREIVLGLKLVIFANLFISSESIEI